jgi:chemotaxis protein histidine kinase CheA
MKPPGSSGTIQRNAHGIKGTARTLFIKRVAKWAWALESDAAEEAEIQGMGDLQIRLEETPIRNSWNGMKMRRKNERSAYTQRTISPTANSSRSSSLKKGIECDSVENGMKAWEILQENPTAYKLLIVDLDMPEMSGLELCQKVREKGWDVPMISLTSDDSREKDLLAAGF